MAMAKSSFKMEHPLGYFSKKLLTFIMTSVLILINWLT